MNDFIKSIVIDFWTTIAEMSPYLLFGFLAAGILSVLVSQRVVERQAIKYSSAIVLIAALAVGAISKKRDPALREPKE